MEELVAEIGSAFLSISLNITHDPGEDNAKYLNNWLAILKDDMRAFTTAASKAQTAADYLHGLQVRTEAAA
jgi:antirestriction protein ArdC